MYKIDGSVNYNYIPEDGISYAIQPKMRTINLKVSKPMRIPAALLSIFIPGTGQFYNREFVKGIFFMLMEHFININAHLNHALFLDFNGFNQQAFKSLNLQYALFYPGFYSYGVWDAFYHAKSDGHKLSVIPFIMAAIVGQFECFYSSKLPHPVLIPGVSIVVVMIIGIILMVWMESRKLKGKM